MDKSDLNKLTITQLKSLDTYKSIPSNENKSKATKDKLIELIIKYTTRASLTKIISPSNSSTSSSPSIPLTSTTSIPSTPLIPLNDSNNSNNSKILDKYYTKINVVDYIYTELQKLLDLKSFGLIVEPSAGNGSFLKYLDFNHLSYLAIDIDPSPSSCQIIKADFLTVNINSTNNKTILTIGNPPIW